MRLIRLISSLLLAGSALAARPAAAQLTDSFTDGDFTQNPAWSGDAADFIVNPSQQLQTNGAAATATRYLVTPARVSGAATWEFWVNLKFGTSSANYADVFLTSDSARLTGANRGYFVRIGGTPDEVSLFRKDGTPTPMVVVDGQDGLLASTTNNIVRVQVTRDAAGNWGLGADITGGTTYASQGTARDTTYGASRWFGVIARYTTTNALKFYFDDFRIIDTAPPALRAPTVLSATSLRVQFDEPVAVAAATTATTYSVTGAGTATTATLDPQDDAAVILTFATAFPGGLNTLTVNYAEDLYGNGTTAPLTKTFRFTAPPTMAGPGDVRFTELLVDPSPVVGLRGPFVEVLNTTTATFDLLGWRLQDATTAGTGTGGTLRAGTLAPGQYGLLTATTDTAAYRSLLGPSVRIIGVTSWPTLNITGDLVRLLTPASLLIDEVRYTDDWYRDPTKAQGGWSLEKINPTKPCSDAGNWIASTDPSGGTPGRQNSGFNNAPDLTAPAFASVIVRTPTRVEVAFSEAIDTLTAAAARFTLTGGLSVTAVNFRPDSLRFVTLTLSGPLVPGTRYTLTATGIADCAGNVATPPLTAPLLLGATAGAGEVRITELFVDPSPVVGLPATQFLEILNVSTKVFELNGWQLQDATGAAGTIGAGILAPGQYAVLTRTTDTTAYRTFLGPGVRLVGITSMPSLNLSGDDVRLLTPAGLLLDAVNYTDDWYRDPAKAQGGWSLEKINPTKPCSDADNWIASTDITGGTPGRQNSMFSNAPDTTPPVALSVAVLGSTLLRVEFSEAIDTLTATTARFVAAPGLTVTAVDFRADSLRFVTLTLGAPLVPGTRYTLTVSGVADCAGNVAPTPTVLPFGLGDAPNLNEVLITEIFADETPLVNLPLTEYLEIHNPTARVLSLAGVRLRKQSTSASNSPAVFPPEATLNPGESAVVCGSTRGILFTNTGAQKIFPLTNFPTLSSAGDTLVLRRPDGGLLFSVAYTDDWYRDAAKADGGWSLEMIDRAKPCGPANNWIASRDPDGGTPGQPNSRDSTLAPLPAPAIANVSVLESGTGPRGLQVRFTQKLDSLTAADPARYAISGGLRVTNVLVRGPELREVRLTLSGALTPGQTVTLTATGLTGCGGASQPLSVAVLVPETPRRGDVVINEILFNPRTGGADFVEVLNRSTRQLDLRGYFLATARGDSLYQIKPLAPDGFPLPPDSLVALTVSPDSVARQYPRSSDRRRLLLVASMPSFSDDKGIVVLLAPDGTVLDSVVYNANQHTPLLTSDDGVSLERIRPDGPSGGTNFHSAASTVGFATPGRPNSQTRPNFELPDNVVSIVPRVITPGQGGAEFADITYAVPGAGYTANFTIFDSQGRLTRRLARNQTLGTTGTFQWDGTDDNRRRAPTGYYVLYAEFFDLNGSVKVFKQTVAVGSR